MAENSDSFVDRSCMGVAARQSVLCLGLDPQPGHIAKAAPELFKKHRLPVLDDEAYGHEHREQLAGIFLDFSKQAMDAVGEQAVWVKLQSAFWEVAGPWGLAALEDAVHYARELGYIVILDGKRGDGGDTAKAYARAYLGPHSPYDALTINGSIGQACVEHFVAALKVNHKAAFTLCRTSFKPDSVLEQALIMDRAGILKKLNDVDLHRGGKPHPSSFEWILDQGSTSHWHTVATMIQAWGRECLGECGWSNLGAVVGATSQESIIARALMPSTWFLVPGYGAQGGGADDAVLGADENGFGITVNSSRGLLYPKDGDIGAAARQARQDLNNALRRAGKGLAWLP